MKKTLRPLCIITLLCSAILFSSCDDSASENIDRALMAGHWVSGTLHERYQDSGSGCTWDTADDVSEAEAQPFTWTLTGNTLVQNHQMEMGGVVPKTYTVTKLTTTTLCYQDDYGTKYTFLKKE